MNDRSIPTGFNARWLVATLFGVLGGLGGIRHGIGEIRQGSVSTGGLVIESWTEGPIATNMDGEPAFTLLPNVLATGIGAVAISTIVILWSLRYLRTRHGGHGLILLSILMFLGGGGFGPPVVALLAGVAGLGVTDPQASRIARWPAGVRHTLAQLFPWVFGVAAANGLLLFIGSVVLVYSIDYDNANLFLGSFFLAVVTIIASTITAAAYDLEGDSTPQPLRTSTA